jgi:hypothetical protein
MSENPTTPKNPAVFFGAIVVAILCVLITAYYLIPMNSYMLASGPGPHYKHIAAFGALAVLSIIAALVTRPKRAA